MHCSTGGAAGHECCLASSHTNTHLFQGVENQPFVNLWAWYAADAAASPEQRELLNTLIKQLSSVGFKIFRKWLFDASIHIGDVNKPLKVHPPTGLNPPWRVRAASPLHQIKIFS